MKYQSTITDVHSVARLMLLEAHLERVADDLSLRTRAELAHGSRDRAFWFAQERSRLQCVAQRVRERVIDATDLALADFDDGGPS